MHGTTNLWYTAIQTISGRKTQTKRAWTSTNWTKLLVHVCLPLLFSSIVRVSLISSLGEKPREQAHMLLISLITCSCAGRPAEQPTANLKPHPSSEIKTNQMESNLFKYPNVTQHIHISGLYRSSRMNDNVKIFYKCKRIQLHHRKTTTDPNHLGKLNRPEHQIVKISLSSSFYYRRLLCTMVVCRKPSILPRC